MRRPVVESSVLDRVVVVGEREQAERARRVADEVAVVGVARGRRSSACSRSCRASGSGLALAPLTLTRSVRAFELETALWPFLVSLSLTVAEPDPPSLTFLGLASWSTRESRTSRLGLHLDLLRRAVTLTLIPFFRICFWLALRISRRSCPRGPCPWRRLRRQRAPMRTGTTKSATAVVAASSRRILIKMGLLSQEVTGPPDPTRLRGTLPPRTRPAQLGADRGAAGVTSCGPSRRARRSTCRSRRLRRPRTWRRR